MSDLVQFNVRVRRSIRERLRTIADVEEVTLNYVSEQALEAAACSETAVDRNERRLRVGHRVQFLTEKLNLFEGRIVDIDDDYCLVRPLKRLEDGADQSSMRWTEWQLGYRLERLDP